MPNSHFFVAYAHSHHWTREIMVSRIFIGSLYFSLASVGFCACLCVLSVVPDCQHFPTPFHYAFAFQVIASLVSLMIGAIIVPSIIAMEQDYIADERFQDFPGFILSFATFFIILTQFVLAFRRIVRVFDGATVDYFYKRWPILQIQTVAILILSLIATGYVAHWHSAALFSSSLLAWRLSPMEWHISVFASIGLYALQLLLLLPALLVIQRRLIRLARYPWAEVNDMMDLIEARASLTRHALADAAFVLLIAIPVPWLEQHAPSALPILCLLRTIAIPLFPVTSTLLCSATMREALTYRCLTLQISRNNGCTVPSQNYIHVGIGKMHF